MRHVAAIDDEDVATARVSSHRHRPRSDARDRQGGPVCPTRRLFPRRDGERPKQHNAAYGY